MKKVMLMAALLALLFPPFLSALNHNKTENVQKAEVIADEAEIFLEASQHSIVIDTIPRGTTVFLFPSGKKNKKWLYIYYLSEKRGSKVTGFVDSHRVEIIKETPPDEPESPEETAEQLSEAKNSDPEEKETRDLKKELEELRNLLNEMEKEKQEKLAQQELEENSEEVVQQEHAEEESEILNERTETQKEENPEIKKTVEQETAELQEAVKEEMADETENKTQKPKEQGEETHALEQEEPQANETATIEEAQETESEESESQNTAKEENADETLAADSFLVLACGQGIHTVIDATDGGMVHPGCDTIFGGETVSETEINEYCSLCGDCITESTGGLCPITLCAKSLLNGPCGGAEDGKCEVDHNRDCGWILIYERLKAIDRLDLFTVLRDARDWSESGHQQSVIFR